MRYLKNIVAFENVRDLNYLNDRIHAATESLTPNKLTTIYSEAEYRFHILLGVYIEIH